jgi:hypothetical protein
MEWMQPSGFDSKTHCSTTCLPCSSPSTLELVVAALANRGIGNEGLVFQQQKPYEGYVYVQNLGQSNAQLYVAINDYVNNIVLDSKTFSIPPSTTPGSSSTSLSPPSAGPTAWESRLGPTPL